MLNKIREIIANKETGEGGFTLIELLVVVIIIGILAAIAIPVFLNQRNGARDASVKSDLNGVTKAIETAYTNNGGYPDVADLNAESPRTSPGNTLYITYYDNNDAIAADETTATWYKICGVNEESTRSFVYNSQAGGLETDNLVGNDDCGLAFGTWLAADATGAHLTVTGSTAS